ncbi:hypothetical protein GF373_06530, partial [bacterium]|nr:hypothetical protein [bacterium]
MNTSSPLIMVIGPGRSGTSLIMQILRAAGINCGQNWIPTNKNNPRGYFELKWVMNFNRFLLRTAANDETSLYPMPDRQSVEALAGIPLPMAFPPHEFA